VKEINADVAEALKSYDDKRSQLTQKQANLQKQRDILDGIARRIASGSLTSFPAKTAEVTVKF